MFAGGDREEVGRWLWNFVTAHARREVLAASAVVQPESPREGPGYGVRVRVGEGVAPPADQPPLELRFQEVAQGRGSLPWCAALAARVRELARAAAAGQGTRKSA